MGADARESAPKIEQLMAALKELSGALGGECTLDRARLFLLVAAKDDGEATTGGVSFSDLYDAFNVATTTVTRNLGALSDRGNRTRDGEGLGLVRIGFSPEDYRQRRVFLEKKGKTAVEKALTAFMKGKP